MYESQHVVEVRYQCIKNMMQIQQNYVGKPAFDYLAYKQSEVTERMRSVLVGWIVGVHAKFNLRLETLYLTVHLIDRYSEIVPIKRKYY